MLPSPSRWCPAWAQRTLLENADSALNRKDLENAECLYRRVLAGERVAGAASPRSAALNGLAARALSARPTDVRLGVEASEAVVKRLDAAGELARYRILHFATHRVLAGELDGASEPGLILTPPRIGSAENDGFLSASEVASLKLDANMVVPSAYNAAAGNVRSAEALTGLARAFIYAQARSLLVSHWAVYSDATVRLVTRKMRELGKDRALPRAEALKRAMNALIASGSEEAYPFYWAPFVVVGEGGAGR